MGVSSLMLRPPRRTSVLSLTNARHALDGDIVLTFTQRQYISHALRRAQIENASLRQCIRETNVRINEMMRQTPQKRLWPHTSPQQSKRPRLC